MLLTLCPVQFHALGSFLGFSQLRLAVLISRKVILGSLGLRPGPVACPPHLSSPLHLCPKPLPLSPIANASQCGRPLILVPGTGRSRLSVTLETPLQNPSTPFNNLLEWCLCVCGEDSACLLHRHYRIWCLHRPILQMRKWRLRALMWLPKASELEFRYLPLPQYMESIPKWAKPSALEGLIPNIWISSSAGRTPEQLISIAAW